ncbi:hypothetical protein Tel_12285 [Candidatus Tenderia electrophaga]|jgi:hypothetical protein|uniref:Adhesin n=1 Tax=Candidatus Tenderia electrophaga TaxID=1748243 RepID=A0A0S2TFC6_9GAMM|nr:hypothetical protein Tel_12285 [Candidatus Tenderia electrophaga]
MAKKNRSTLKRYFREGALPSADQFGDLIDSALNTIDEGFDRSAENGFEISLVGDHDRLISFFRNSAEQQAAWSVSYDKRRDTLRFIQPGQGEEAGATLVLGPGGRVGVNRDNPQWALDVNGIVAARGRIGVNPGDQTSVPADGRWHNIAGPLRGCQGFEVMAGAGNKGTGKYALMNAVALNTFNPRGWLFNFLNLKKRIKYHQAYYLSRGNRIKLRWLGEGEEYYLQLRTVCDYGAGVRVRYYLTQLWFDDDMSESWADLQGSPDEAQGD